MSSTLEKHSCGGKDTSLGPWVVGVVARAALRHRKKRGQRMWTKREREPSKEPRRHARPPVRDIRFKGSSEDTMSSSKRGKFHCYICKIIIYSVKEYRGHFTTKVHCLEVVCRDEKVLRHCGRSPLPFICQPWCRFMLPDPRGSLTPREAALPVYNCLFFSLLRLPPLFSSEFLSFYHQN